MGDQAAKRSDVPKRFFTTAEQVVIVAAIAAAEARTSGEIRLHVERDVPRRGAAAGDPYLRARQLFAALGMHRTEARNGVLVYLATRARQLAIVGDEGLHGQVGDEFWRQVVDRMTPEFAAGRPAEGIAAGVAMIGEKLRAFFPRLADDVNELPDDISFAP